jgi:hypothetical protein
MDNLDFGIWTDHSIPEDRNAWHPNVRRFYEYWCFIAPAGRLPGRQHFDPLDIFTLLPRVWMLNVHRDPLRYKYRLASTYEVNTHGREITGQWLDEVNPQVATNPKVRDRYAYMTLCGRPTYRKGGTTFSHQQDRNAVENCIVPLAADGRTVDILLAYSILYRVDGSVIPN